MKILLVENDADFCKKFKIPGCLECSVYKAFDSRSAEKIFSEIQPDCCIINLQLPKYFAENDCYEGLELANRLFAQHSGDIKFILLSREKCNRIKSFRTHRQLSIRNVDKDIDFEEWCNKKNSDYRLFIVDGDVFD